MLSCDGFDKHCYGTVDNPKQATEPLYLIDDGTKSYQLCANHLASLVHQVTKFEDYQPANFHVSTRAPKVCELCSEPAIMLQDWNATVFLCNNHLRSLIKLKLKPAEFFNLYNKHGIFHLIHDDFYDIVTGEALQAR